MRITAAILGACMAIFIALALSGPSRECGNSRIIADPTLPRGAVAQYDDKNGVIRFNPYECVGAFCENAIKHEIGHCLFGPSEIKADKYAARVSSPEANAAAMERHARRNLPGDGKHPSSATRFGIIEKYGNWDGE